MYVALQGMGRAPAATDLAYFLRQIDVGKEGTAAAERIELVLQVCEIDG